ncbi:MAG: hypothetical protein ACRDY7_05515, partial [Acidimicrobiia bacterium]
MTQAHIEVRCPEDDRESSWLRSRSRTLFTELPDVLIQDPIRSSSYLISAAELAVHVVTSDVWPRIDGGTVTFVIPGGDAVEEMPPFRQEPDLRRLGPSAGDERDHPGLLHCQFRRRRFCIPELRRRTQPFGRPDMRLKRRVEPSRRPTGALSAWAQRRDD